MKLFNRWSIGKVKKKLLKLNHVYDVLYEKPAEGKYLIHIFVEEMTERVQAILQPQIKQAVGRIPPDMKVDVLLYRRNF